MRGLPLESNTIRNTKYTRFVGEMVLVPLKREDRHLGRNKCTIGLGKVFGFEDVARRNIILLWRVCENGENCSTLANEYPGSTPTVF